MTASLFTLLFIGLIMLSIIGTLPIWPYSRTWDYYPCSLLGVLLVLLLMLMLLDRI
ncbi:MAG TPA: DUF3309 family protein [Alphaproteobacteria bacterium]|nr:DUF3309 family protein [Alphaproteobacteria bacterium]